MFWYFWVEVEALSHQCSAMDLKRLLRTQLVSLCEELGVEVQLQMTKASIIEAIESTDLAKEEIVEMWNEILRRKADEQKLTELQIEKLRLEVELRKTSVVPESEGAGRHDLYDLSKLMQPFKVGQDIACIS